MADFEVVGMPAEDQAAWQTALGVSSVIELTTSAVQTDFDPNDYPNALRLVIKITSGGTAGQEAIRILKPVDNATMTGLMINLVLWHQTDGDDEVDITTEDAGNGAEITCLNSIGNSAIGTFETGVLAQEGSNLILMFDGEEWTAPVGQWNNDTEITQIRENLPSGGQQGQLPYNNTGDGSASWQNPNSSQFPFKLRFSTVSDLNTNGHPGIFFCGIAIVTDADTPVVGSAVAGGGGKLAMVASNGTDYIVVAPLGDTP